MPRAIALYRSSRARPSPVGIPRNRSGTASTSSAASRTWSYRLVIPTGTLSRPAAVMARHPSRRTASCACATAVSGSVPAQ